METSAIFKAYGSSLLDNDNDGRSNSLQKNIYQNILAFRRDLQSRKLYILLHKYVTLNQITLNNVITSSYLLHNKPRIKSKESKLSQVTTKFIMSLTILIGSLTGR